MAPRKPKKDPKEAADAAEARAKGKKTAQTTKAPKAAAAPKAKAAEESPNTDREMKALFLQNLTKLATLVKSKDEAVAAIRNAYKTAKADGFMKIDFDDAFAIQKADGEKKKRAAIMRSLKVAQWLGCDLGQQYDLFAEPSRVPAADRAFEEGQTASMTGKPLKCDYHESTEQYRQFVAGFNSHQETLQAGFQKLEPKEGEPGYPTGPDYPKQPSNVVAMTRAEADAQRAKH